LREYAVIDIETTGGNSVNHRVIEIAVFIHDGSKVIDQFETLINPERKIPAYIEGFTGITNEMVQNAPVFADIAEKLEKITAGRVFVAHNVNFDYGFIRKEFNLLDKTFKRSKLCTVRLSRSLIPDLPSYGLGSICQSLRIPINGRHRAAGDGEATVTLLEKLLERDHEGFIEAAIKRGSKEAVLPPNLPREDYEKLPEKTGVYYFFDKYDQILYIGKAKNIKERVTSHFRGNTNTRSRQLFMEKVCKVDFLECGNELVALLHESAEIKKYWPPMNRAQKRLHFQYGIYEYVDQNGYCRLSLSRVTKYQQPIVTFYSLSEGRTWLFEKAREFNLCPKFCGLQNSPDECFDYPLQLCEGACGGHESAKDYNTKVATMLNNISYDGASFAVIGKGRIKDENSVILIDNGMYAGYTYVPASKILNRKDEVSALIDIEPSDNPDIHAILRSFLAKDNQHKIVELD